MPACGNQVKATDAQLWADLVQYKLERGTVTEILRAWRSGRNALPFDGVNWTSPILLATFARKHDISEEQARELMRKIGGDREILNEAAARLF